MFDKPLEMHVRSLRHSVNAGKCCPRGLSSTASVEQINLWCFKRGDHDYLIGFHPAHLYQLGNDHQTLNLS
jgi:hypothetical protein